MRQGVRSTCARLGEFVSRLAAYGDTDIASALDAGFAAPAEDQRLSLVAFLTDGRPSVGEQRRERIADRIGGRIGATRVFAIGVGHDVTTYLLDRLAAEGRGAVEYVPPDGDVALAVGELLRKLRPPVLVDVRVVEAPAELCDLEPGVLPDLFHGEELVVFGRYRGRGAGPVVIEGRRPGRRERVTLTAELPRLEHGNGFVPRLRAARRIGRLPASCGGKARVPIPWSGSASSPSAMASSPGTRGPWCRSR